MKKIWITYHLIMVLILLVLIVFGIATNIGKSGNNIITDFTEIALYISAINILITMPIWIVVLLFNKRRMDKKELLIGLCLFLAFVELQLGQLLQQLAIWPIKHIRNSRKQNNSYKESNDKLS